MVGYTWFVFLVFICLSRVESMKKAKKSKDQPITIPENACTADTIKNEPIKSDAECIALCKATVGCIAVTILSPTGAEKRCWLKRKCWPLGRLATPSKVVFLNTQYLLTTLTQVTSSNEQRVQSSEKIFCIQNFGNIGFVKGDDFRDTNYVKFGKITSIKVCRGKSGVMPHIAGIQFTYGVVPGPFHGSEDNCQTADLADDEFIVRAQGKSTHDDTKAINLNRIEFDTNKGRTLGPYGSIVGEDFTVGGKGRYLAMIGGKKTATIVNRLTFFFYCDPFQQS